jgi:hypothetical protein
MTHEIQFQENDGKVANFATYEEAEAAQAICYANHMANHNDNHAYTAQTTKWCEPFQRIDGTWDIFVCHHTDATEATNLSEYNAANYPDEPEE